MRTIIARAFSMPYFIRFIVIVVCFEYFFIFIIAVYLSSSFSLSRCFEAIVIVAVCLSQ